MAEESLARTAIEHLRSGIPSRLVSARYSMGHEAILTRVAHDMDCLEKAEPSRHLCILRAPYGEGKSHMLHAIWNEAVRRRWVVSWATLSRETPFDKLGTVYRKMIENTFLPGAAQPGLRRLVEAIKPNSPAGDALFNLAGSELHPKLSIVMRNIIEGAGTDSLDGLYRDLSGDFLTAPDLKGIHRLNFHEPAKFPPFRKQTDVFDYFRLMDHLAYQYGRGGWLILLDELELVGKLGSKARARAYANLLTFNRGALRHTYVVCALADIYYGQVIAAREEAGRLPQWLEDRGENDLATATRDAVHLLESDAVRLEPLSEEHVVGILRQVLADHALGYGWDPGMDGMGLYRRVKSVVTNVDAKIRTLIRAAVWWLDIRFQYGQDPTLKYHDLSDTDLSEAPTEGGLEPAAEQLSSGPMLRRKIF